MVLVSICPAVSTIIIHNQIPISVQNHIIILCLANVNVDVAFCSSCHMEELLIKNSLLYFILLLKMLRDVELGATVRPLRLFPRLL